jgi:hypothetical protein
MKGPWNEEQLLAAFRDERGPGSMAEDRLWARLATDIEKRSRPRSRQRSTWIVAAFAAAAAAVVIIAWPEPRVLDAQGSEAPSLLPHERDSGSGGDVAQPSAPRTSTREAPLPVNAEASTPGDTDAPVNLVAPDAAEPVRKRAPRSSRRPPREATESPPLVEQDSLAAETQLLRRARAALSRGNPQRALAVLAEYEREHPNGLLAEEADAVLTIAKCRSTPSQGAQLARSFSARNGGSLFRAQVQAACVLDSGDE